jgi:hypothetical protein
MLLILLQKEHMNQAFNEAVLKEAGKKTKEERASLLAKGLRIRNFVSDLSCFCRGKVMLNINGTEKVNNPNYLDIDIEHSNSYRAVGMISAQNGWHCLPFQPALNLPLLLRTLSRKPEIPGTSRVLSGRIARDGETETVIQRQPHHYGTK